MIKKIILKHIKGPELAYIFPSDDQLIIQVLKPEMQKEVEGLINRIIKNLPTTAGESRDLHLITEELNKGACTIQGKPVSAYLFTSGV